MKKSEVRQGQVVAVKGTGDMGTVVYKQPDWATVRMAKDGGTEYISYRNLELVIEPDAECHGCNCTNTLHLKRTSDGRYVIECHNCSGTFAVSASRMAGRPATINPKALELGNLISRWVENRHQAMDCDEWEMTAKRQAADSGHTAAERRKSADAAHYFNGQGYGIMNERLLIEDLMAELGLVDLYQLAMRELNVTNANSK